MQLHHTYKDLINHVWQENKQTNDRSIKDKITDVIKSFNINVVSIEGLEI
jgi:hypothetical protein